MMLNSNARLLVYNVISILLYHRTFESYRTIRIMCENRMGYKLAITIKIDSLDFFFLFLFFFLFIGKTSCFIFDFSVSTHHSLTIVNQIFITDMNNCSSNLFLYYSYLPFVNYYGLKKYTVPSTLT